MCEAEVLAANEVLHDKVAKIKLKQNQLLCSNHQTLLF